MKLSTPSPQTRSGHDFSANPLIGAPKIDYKAGKLESASVKMYFDGKIDPEYLTQGFSYYDQEEKQRRSLPSFTAYVLGVYYGSFSDGGQKGDVRYISNLVFDTRTDILQSSYFVDGQRRTFAIGNYQADISPAFKAMGRGSSYTKVLVAYVAELKSVCAFHLSATAEAGILKAIAKARGIEEYKANLFGLSELTTEVWVFRYEGQSEAVVFTPNDAKKTPPTVPATKDSHQLYFQPIFSQAGVITATAHPEKFASVRAMSDELSEYIASEQAFFKGQIGEKPKETEGVGNEYYGPEPLGRMEDIGVGEGEGEPQYNDDTLPF